MISQATYYGGSEIPKVVGAAPPTFSGKAKVGCFIHTAAETQVVLPKVSFVGPAFYVLNVDSGASVQILDRSSNLLFEVQANHAALCFAVDLENDTWLMHDMGAAVVSEIPDG